MRLPFARPSRVDDASVSDSVLSWQLPAELSERLNDLERDSGASYFVARLAAVSAHLMETTGSRDLLIGVQVAAHLFPELQGVAGPMPNLMPVQAAAGGNADAPPVDRDGAPPAGGGEEAPPDISYAAIHGRSASCRWGCRRST